MDPNPHYFQNTSPLVSICIPMYNAEKTIEKTLTSILNQTYKNIEVIIVDNCSTDHSVTIVQGFKDSRVSLYRYYVYFPRGEPNANRCFQYAHGEYMAIFHADDIYTPTMVSRQVETFMRYPGVAGVFTQGNLINENDETIGEFKLLADIKGGKPYSYQELLDPLLKYADFFPTPTAMIRKDIYVKCSPFRHDQFSSASDLDMWLRVAEQGSLVILDEKLINYRVSKTQGSNLLNRLRTEESDFFKVMDFHIAKNKDKGIISKTAMDSYELSRFGDQILCAKNMYSKEGWASFITKLTNIKWLNFLTLSLLNPVSLYSKFRMFLYFKGFKR